MKRSTFTNALLAMALGVTAGATVAQPRDRDDDRRGGGRDGRGGPGRDDRHDRPGRHDVHGRPPHHRHGGPPPHPHGGPPGQHWRRGDRLPPAYRTRYYVVDDWRGHRLQRPPRGYHWVQVGADYVLIAIATGIIAQVLLAR